jgi:hypothetical protein
MKKIGSAFHHDCMSPSPPILLYHPSSSPTCKFIEGTKPKDLRRQLSAKHYQHNEKPSNMAPFFPYRSSPERASSAVWSEETCQSPGRDSNEQYSAFSPATIENDISSLTFDDDGYTSESDGSANDKASFEQEQRESTDGESLLDFNPLSDDRVTDTTPRTGMRRGLAQFTFAIVGLLMITVNIEHILNTILVLLLFVPYPYPLRHSRFVLFALLLAHGSVPVKAKSECILIFSIMSALSGLDWASAWNRVRIGTRRPLQVAVDSDVGGDRDEVMQDPPGEMGDGY